MTRPTWLLVASEFGGTPLPLTQSSVEHIGGFLARKNGDENAATPKRGQ